MNMKRTSLLPAGPKGRRDGEKQRRVAEEVSKEGGGGGGEDEFIQLSKDFARRLSITEPDELREKWRAKKRERLARSVENERGGQQEKREKRERWSKTGRSKDCDREVLGVLNEIEKDGQTDREREEGGVDIRIESESTWDGGMEGQQGGEMESTWGGSQQGAAGDGESERWRPTVIACPILSRMLMHSSASSSSSSFNLSSAESDEVFSEGEEAAASRNTLKKSRSWRTFVTMMHWSARRQSPWVQLAGHQGTVQLGDGGEVLKLFSEVEASCLQALMADPLRLFVPRYHGSITREGHRYLRLDDLLRGLTHPVIMDCKMGVRTYQEEELVRAHTKPTPRTDMYQKMVKVDPTALLAEEHKQRGVTKWRYLQWRDSTSSTSSLGFRIEGIMMENGSVQRDFRRMMTSVQVTEALLSFTKSQLHILRAYHSRLQALGEALKESPFFRTHEVIGSSLLFVHDSSSKASIWMIDFGKTTPAPSGTQLRHDVQWSEGNREDGYLIGLASLTSLLGQAIARACRRGEGEEEEGGEEEEADPSDERLQDHTHSFKLPLPREPAQKHTNASL